MDDQTTAQLIAGQARIEQMVADMHNRLFGNGQPGIIQYLSTKLETLDCRQTQMETDNRVVQWRLSTLSAILGSVVTGLATWFGHRLGL